LRGLRLELALKQADLESKRLDLKAKKRDREVARIREVEVKKRKDVYVTSYIDITLNFCFESLRVNKS